MCPRIQADSAEPGMQEPIGTTAVLRLLPVEVRNAF